MTHCPWCPFKGCPECAYRGGEIPAAQANCETMGVRKTAPEQCANTAEGLTTTTVEESRWL